MRKHVDLVGVLYWLWGGMLLLVSVSLLSTGFAATAIGAYSPQDSPGGRVTAGIVAAGFFTLSAAGFLFGTLHVWIGIRVRGLREWARAAGIVLAIANLVLPPFGTAIGVYTLWALLHTGSKPLFHPAAGAD